MRNLENSKNKFDKRSGIDRRKTSPTLFNKYLITGRRRRSRRDDDSKSPKQFDRYSNKLLILIVVILVLSIIDAVFTILLIDKGAIELNPVMSFYINVSQIWFICIKYFLTSASLILLLFCNERMIFRIRIRVKNLLYLFSIFFIIVIYWQIYLMKLYL